MSSEYNPEAEARALWQKWRSDSALLEDEMADDIAAALRAAYRSGLEDAAKVAESRFKDWTWTRKDAGENIADAIRALAAAKEGERDG
jgi:hypothetical protein